MKTFATYYNASRKEFAYTIKLARNDMSANDSSSLETFLNRYNLKSFSKAKKTPIQMNPIDFPNVQCSSVYIIDVVLEYPITPDALRREVADITGMGEAATVVYAENDPRHQYTEQVIDRVVNKEEFKSKYVPKLGSAQEYEPEPAYGDAYNGDFLKSLKDVSKSKGDNYVTNDLVPEYVSDDVTITGEEKSKQNNDAVLTDRWRDASDESPNKAKNTMMSTPSKESK